MNVKMILDAESPKQPIVCTRTSLTRSSGTVFGNTAPMPIRDRVAR